MRPLRMMLASIIGSFTTLLWSLLMMSLIMYIFGLCFMQGVAGYLQEKQSEEIPEDTLDGIISYWSSVHQSTITLYMAVTGGSDWEPLAEPIREVGPIYYTLFLGYIAFFMIAVLNVLTGMFVDTAMKVGESDSAAVLEQIEESSHQQVDNLRSFLQSLDTEQTNTITWDAVQSNVKAEPMEDFLHVFQMNLGEMKHVYQSVEMVRGEGEVDIIDFVAGCAKIMSDHETVEMMLMMISQRRLANQVCQLMEYTDERMTEMHEIFKAWGAPVSSVEGLGPRLARVHCLPRHWETPSISDSIPIVPSSISQAIPQWPQTKITRNTSHHEPQYSDHE